MKHTRGTDGTRKVTTFVTIRSDLTWQVKSHEHAVSYTSKSLANIPPVLNPSNAMNLLKDIDCLTLCPGNPDPEFVSLCHKRGGTIKGQKGHGDVVAFVDETAVVDSTGNTFSCTVQGKSCEVVCEQTGRYPTHCNPCKSFRSTLRTSLCREKKPKDDMNPSSCTPYKYMSSSAKNERLRNLHQQVRCTKACKKRLETNIQQLIEKEGVVLGEKDAADISCFFSNLSSHVTDQFPEDSPQCVLCEEQRKYNSLSDKSDEMASSCHSICSQPEVSLNFSIPSCSPKRIPQLAIREDIV